MFVKISSLVLCLVLIQSTINAAASGDTEDKSVFILPAGGDVYEGSEIRKKCLVLDDNVVTWWSKGGININKGEDRRFLVMKNVTRKDSGTYICNARLKWGSIVSVKIDIKVTVPKITPVKIEHIVKVRGNVTLSCLVNKTSFKDFAWKLDGSENVMRFDYLKSKNDHNDTHYSLNLYLDNVSRNENGTYVCEAEINGRKIENRTHLRVLERPEISNFDVRPIGAGNIRLNWTLFDGNSPVRGYNVSFEAEGNRHYVSLEKPEVSNCTACSYYLKSDKLEKHKSYRFKIATWNSEGDSNTVQSGVVNMSMIDPVDTIPTKFTTSTTDGSITIMWSLENMTPNPSYHYRIKVNDLRKSESLRSYNSKNKATRHVIEKLEPRTTYVIKVQGCLDDEVHREKKCTEWTVRNVTTKSSDGSSSVSRSTGEFGLMTLTTIVSMFLFKYDEAQRLFIGLGN